MIQRRNVLKGLSAGSLSGWGAVAWAAGTRPVKPGVRKILGEVFVNGVAAQEGHMVALGDTVSTGAASEAIYVIGSNAYLLREKTKVRHTDDALIGVMRVITGKVLSVFGPGQQRIDTPTATVGIRGTGCYIEAQDDRVYFCLCYGAANIVPVADASQSRALVTQHHDAPFYIGADLSKALIQAAPVINHRDYELTMLESTVGRRPPFATDGRSGY